MSVLNTNKQLFFNFFLVFYFTNAIVKSGLKILKMHKRKAVLLKSPFHYKVFKYNIGYYYYNLKLNFYVYSKLFFEIKHKLLLIISVFKVKKIQYSELNSFNVSNLILYW